MMNITLPVDNHDYLSEKALSPNKESTSPTSVAHDSLLTSGTSTANQVNAAFIEAPQKLFGKYLKINVEGRTVGEKKENQDLRAEFHENLHAFFGPILAEYLYPKEIHDQMLQQGMPLTPLHAQETVKKGMEMMDALAEYCTKCLADSAQKLSQPDLLDQAMIHYANEQEAVTEKQDDIMGLLPHAAKAVGGGTMAALALASMGHLTPGDIFFLADLLANKKMTKAVEDFISAKLTQHIEYHLEAYVQERRKSHMPLAPEEEKELRKLLANSTQLFSRDYASPVATSCTIRAGVEGINDISHAPIEAMNYILFSPLETISAGGIQSRFFRQGVTTLIDNVKKIQDSISKKTASLEELSKIKRAIDLARQKAAAAVAETEGAGTWRDVPEQKPLKSKVVTVVRKQPVILPPWRRGI